CIDRGIDLIVFREVVADPAVAHRAIERRREARAIGHIPAQITAYTERAEAIGSVLERLRRSVQSKRRALERTARDESIFCVLELLRILDDGVLRLSVVGLSNRTNQKRGSLEPRTTIGARSNT